MARQYFGTDGIRGRVGQSPITPDFVLRLAHAVGRVLKASEAHPVVLIGKDTRISGYMLESALESGFNSAGVDVLLLGPVPTPAVAYLTRAQRASLGVVISASHNPFEDNGIKFFSAEGTKLSDEWEMAVEAALQEPPAWVDSAALGKTRRLDDAAGRYIEFCKSTFPNHLSLKGLRIVVDAAHGAAYQIAPKVFHELGADVFSIGCSPDGLNINKGVGATHPQALVDAVKLHRADIGIALDGDADRLQIVDASGRLFNGDELLYLMVRERLDRGMSVPGAVGTLMTNMAVEVALKRCGVEFVAPGWVTVTCSKCWPKKAGCWAARAPAICWRWTSTPLATVSSAPCRCCRPAWPAARRWPSCLKAWSCFRKPSSMSAWPPGLTGRATLPCRPPRARPRRRWVTRAGC